MSSAQHLAVIDLGSNTARLVVFSYQPNHSFKLLDELRQVVRLSEGMGDAQIIRADAFQRGLNALTTFSIYCKSAGITNIVATATSAVRDAANGQSFMNAVKDRTGLELRILSGEEEAHYGTLAVTNSMNLNDAITLDIGGGSAQLSHMKAKEFNSGQSWPLGAVRMTENFLKSDSDSTPSTKNIKALRKHINAQIGDWRADKPTDLPLVGMGGTLRNLASIQQKQENYPVDIMHGYSLKKDALDNIVEMLISKTTVERKKISGLNPDRADIIVAGAIVAQELLAHTQASEIIISGQGIREGLLYDHLFDSPNHSLVDNVRNFSILNLSRRYYDNPAHNNWVQKLALELFDALEPLHNYGTFEHELLTSAALIHDIGMAINYYDHHKHGYFLTMSTALPGFSHREQALLALLVRYHRKGKPNLNNLGLDMLWQADDLERVSKLSALLRMAEYLERSKAQRVKELRCHLDKNYLQIEVIADGDAQIEVQAAQERSDLLSKSYGLHVEIMLGH